MIAKAVIRRRVYNLQFNKEDDSMWYIDFPHWPFSHDNLLMVGAADRLCSFLAGRERKLFITAIPSNKDNKELIAQGYVQLVRVKRGKQRLWYGATYKVKNLPRFEREIWICPVTLFVFGRYPGFIYIKKRQPEA